MRPPVEWIPSPNFTAVSPDRDVTCIVLHATATEGIDSPLRELCDPKPKTPEKRVSAHYLIGKDGRILHLVHETNVAWHAGVSAWKGRIGVNNFSIGIELVNLNNGADPYPKPQLDACAGLVLAICQERGVHTDDVIGHLNVAPGRKDDPKGLDLVAFRKRLLPWAAA
mgnify:CR=1 FL=1